MMRKTVYWVLIVATALLINVQLQGQGPPDEVPEEVFTIFGMTPGIIFNTSNLLLDLAAYQSGVGLMLRNEDFALRSLVSLEYESGNDLFESTVGLAYMQPFFSGGVYPYWGVSLIGGYSFDRDEFDSQNWTETRALTAELAAIFGAELFLLKFLSVFAEYKLGISFSRSQVNQGSNGLETETLKKNFRIGTDLGNEASIGVVLYLSSRPLTSGETEQ